MWPFDIAARRRATEDQARWVEHERWCREIHAAGFTEWHWRPPSDGSWVELARHEWPARHVAEVDALPPEMNTAALYWRPWRGETIEQTVLDG